MNIIIYKKKTIVSNVGRGCCSKELNNSKTKKAKVELLVDKPKTMKIKHNDFGQEEVVANERYAMQPFLHEG